MKGLYRDMQAHMRIYIYRKHRRLSFRVQVPNSWVLGALVLFIVVQLSAGIRFLSTRILRRIACYCTSGICPELIKTHIDISCSVQVLGLSEPLV